MSNILKEKSNSTIFNKLKEDSRYKQLKEWYDPEKVEYIAKSIIYLISDLSKYADKGYQIPRGTSSLVRTANKIFITKRKYNYSTYNSVCISDEDREDFFKNLRENKVKNSYPRLAYAIYKDTNSKLFEKYNKKLDKLYYEHFGG